MRINQFVARASGASRRAADEFVASGRVSVNGQTASAGQQVSASDTVELDGKVLAVDASVTIMLNKPVGYVCSRNGQGASTIYDLLPPEFHNLKPVGRLDKDSSGLLLLTSDGQLALELTHPKFLKEKVYQLELNKPLDASDKTKIEQGITLEDGLSKLALAGSAKSWTVTMGEGRNRQIRRTFAALGYEVIKLHRTKFGEYTLGLLESGSYSAEID